METLVDVYNKIDSFLGYHYGQVLSSYEIQTGDLITKQYVDLLYTDVQKIAVHQTGQNSFDIARVLTNNLYAAVDSDFSSPTGIIYNDPAGERKGIQRYYDTLINLKQNLYLVHPSQVTTTPYLSTSVRIRPWQGGVHGQTGITYVVFIDFDTPEFMRLFLNTGCSISVDMDLVDGDTAKSFAWEELVSNASGTTFSEIQDNWDQTIEYGGIRYYETDKLTMRIDKVSSTRMILTVDLIDNTTVSGNNTITGELSARVRFGVSNFYWNVVGSNDLTDVVTLTTDVDFTDFLPRPTYSLSMPRVVDEGEIIPVVLNTEYVSDGELVPFGISGVFGSAIDRMWLNGSQIPTTLSGNFVVSNNRSTLDIETVQDPEDVDKRLTVQLLGKDVQRSTSIRQVVLPINQGIWCLSIIDEDYFYARRYVNTDYRAFKSNFPDRRLFVLAPGSFNVRLPVGWGSDPMTRGPIYVNRDYGRRSRASDWYSLCGMNEVPDNYAVALSVDNSGSMRTSHVRASISLLRSKLAQRNIRLIVTNMPGERWIRGHVRSYS